MSPDLDELEVSFLGPGYGESIVMHLGLGDWVVVDSCRDPDSNECLPLRYLDSIGVDTHEQVRLIVATHWHDDHISGIAELYKRCRNAILACPAAVQDKDFFTLVYLLEEAPLPSSGIGELYEILQERESGTRVESRLKFAKAETPLWSRSGDLPATVTALSPTDQGIYRALQVIAGLLPDESRKVLRVRRPNRNDASVAAWVDVAGTQLLLGADLEEQSVHNWTEVLASETKPSGLAQVFKVPHHGSANAHHDGVWEDMLTDDVVPVLCPWSLAGKLLPTDGDVERICELASPAYLTARRKIAPSPQRPKAVTKTLKQTGIKVRPAQPAPGQVRLRKSATGDEWSVELLNGSQSAC